ncbi:MAG: TetR/AcrR family transcriptional regulator [Bacteroidetes bacterium]|nr:TetR/AcrR family transcriptional regulator [Bacteroidota bacterium]
MNKYKDRIIDESIQLFVKHGIRSVTMDEIAKQCGISKRTLYENFKDKEELLIHCVEKIHEMKRKHHEEIVKTSDNVIEVLLTKITQMMKDASQLKPAFHKEINKYYPSVAEIQQKFFKEFAANEIHRFIKEGISQGLFRKELNVEIVTDLLMGQIQYVINELSENTKYSFVEIFKTMMLSFARGISTNKGIGLIETFEKNNIELYK